MSDIPIAPAAAAEEAHKNPSPARSLSEDPIAVNGSPTQSPPGPARIRKKRSTASVQPLYQTKASASGPPADAPSSASASQASTPVKGARKGSLRNVVRRIFGRKPKVEEPEPQQPAAERNAPRHGHTTSDPGTLRAIPEQPQDGAATNPNVPQRAISAPLKSVDASGVRKGRSPYAVEFPQSSRLKPLDLGNPFHKDGREPRRRATLPSIIIDEKEAAALARELNAKSDEHAPGVGLVSAPYHDEQIGLAVTTPSRKQHRKSRSADDLRRMVQSLQPVRDRDGEVNYWRQSAAGSVLLNPGSVSKEQHMTHDSIVGAVSPMQHMEDDPFVVRGTAEPYDDGKVSPLVEETAGKAPPMRDSPLMSRPATAESTAGDLEARVLRLENSVAGFQVAIDRLAAGANRRTVIIDSATSGSTARGNTPSVLINSLLDADYRYSNTYAGGEENYSIRAGPPEESQRPRHSAAQPSPARTHAALYSIINQERTARRALEDQVRHLQDKFSEMQYQLSQPIIGRHSSVYQPQTQVHQAYQRMPHYSNAPTDAVGQRLTSRFSRSDSLTDSEAARLRETSLDADDDRAKSFDLYQTPADEQRQRSHLEPVEGGMF